jgi:uncharacterized protein (DUF342 family)
MHMGSDEEALEGLRELLERLEAEEQEVSELRRKVHDRLASFPNETTERQERELSARRRELHAEIDRVRVERNRLLGELGEKT